MASATITRQPEHPGYTALGGVNTPGEDYLLLADGQPFGGTYWCSSGDIPKGSKWASWGPAGYSMGHRTRTDAEQVQIDAWTAMHDLAAYPARGARICLTRHTAGNTWVGTHTAPDFAAAGTVIETPRDGSNCLIVSTDVHAPGRQETDPDSPETWWIGDQTVTVAIAGLYCWTITPLD
ncbi:hypothetical protein ACFFMN_23250 [Planobispora siamensis]|uniref:Uncharacterized protein n=1 Tax=Planobispora siamensis TaxID=936338 RepID=A0A8J3SL67_9ACTN|nr:hypothetical protein [Planobispora siamensis]GIH95279.1 hypothetical protein Psi01_59090 [Planobispora siamensis]